jgi:serine/threonine protein kinase
MPSPPDDKRESAKSNSTVVATPFGDGQAPDATTLQSPQSSREDAPWSGTDEAPRYISRGLLGEGGMGEVRLCEDRRIGREVAMKVVRPGHGSRSAGRPRFLHEARVQGQLEHPSIVPVYDLATNDSGQLYFTMKRVRGVTLESIFETLRHPRSAGEGPSSGSLYSRHKLLTAFASVCLTVDYAHSRGIIHRDLKPSNIMFGDFGELYVLDWGLAKQMGEGEPDLPVPAKSEPSGLGSGKTTRGAVMGTAGYMAPEQFRGEVESLDQRTDVYALGAVLFEILAARPLHDQATASEVKKSTLRGAEARPSVRAPHVDVPPELEAVCVRATELDPKDRFNTAREMSDAIERYLEGDRDLALRCTMAVRHAAAAARAADRTLANGTDSSPSARSDALREVSRALALDPNNASAIKTLVRLLTEPPRELPREVAEEERAAARASQRTAARNGAIAFASWFLYVPLMVWAGIRNVTFFLLQQVIFAALVGLSVYYSRKPLANGETPYPAIVLTMLAVVSISSGLSPFILVSGIAAASTMAFLVQPGSSRRLPIVLIGCATVILPFILEWMGVVPASYAFRDGVLVILPRVVNMTSPAMLAILVIANVALVPTIALWVVKFRDTLSDAERKQYLFAWQLKQLVPPEARQARAGH